MPAKTTSGSCGERSRENTPPPSGPTGAQTPAGAGAPKVDPVPISPRTAQSINAPVIFRIDTAKRTIRGRRDDGSEQTTEIQSVKNDAGNLMLQGVVDGTARGGTTLGWTMRIAAGSGRMTLTAAGEDVAFVVFGSCMAP